MPYDPHRFEQSGAGGVHDLSALPDSSTTLIASNALVWWVQLAGLARISPGPLVSESPCIERSALRGPCYFVINNLRQMIPCRSTLGSSRYGVVTNSTPNLSHEHRAATAPRWDRPRGT